MFLTEPTCGAMYSQCGGIGWTGLITCCTGSNCTVSNQYYSQCLPTASPSSSSIAASSTVRSSTIPSGSAAGVTTRYWDCCKPSCAWPGKASVTQPVKTCAADGATAVDASLQSGCGGGRAYMCNNQQPWSVNSTLAYGYVAANIAVNKITYCSPICTDSFLGSIRSDMVLRLLFTCLHVRSSDWQTVHRSSNKHWWRSG